MNEQHNALERAVRWLVGSLIGIAVVWTAVWATHIPGVVELGRSSGPRQRLAEQSKPKLNVQPIKRVETIQPAKPPLESGTEARPELERAEVGVTIVPRATAEVQKREQAIGTQMSHVPSRKWQIDGKPPPEDIKKLTREKNTSKAIEQSRAELEREALWLEREQLVRRWTINDIEVIAEFVDFRKNKVIVRDFHNRERAISPQQLSASDRAWYRSVLRPVDDPIRKEQVRQYRAARTRAKSAARRANQRNAMRKLDAELRNQRRAFQRWTRHR